MTRFTLGLDLGQAQDYTALVIVDRAPDAKGTRYAVPHIQRWPLGTPYPTIVNNVAAIMQSPQLVECTLVVDATGVGRPVVDLFALAHCHPIGVMITAGSHATRDPDTNYWMVPKKELVSTVAVCLQSGAVQIARALPEAATLIDELVNFQVKITAAANETYGEWRVGKHDDLVLSLSLALWWNEWMGTPGV